MRGRGKEYKKKKKTLIRSPGFSFMGRKLKAERREQRRTQRLQFNWCRCSVEETTIMCRLDATRSTACIIRLLSDTQEFALLLLKGHVVRVPACSSLTAAEGVCVRVLAVLSLCGIMRAGSPVRQTRHKDSHAWVTSQRSKGREWGRHFRWCMVCLGKRENIRSVMPVKHEDSCATTLLHRSFSPTTRLSDARNAHYKCWKATN